MKSYFLCFLVNEFEKRAGKDYIQSQITVHFLSNNGSCIYSCPFHESCILITSNCNHRFKSAVDMPISVLKRGDLCIFT